MTGNNYDAIVAGAGVGGLTVASLLAHEGWKVLLAEQSDRVGGRATTFKGEEIMDNGEQWYRKRLGQQYTWLAKSNPSIKEIISSRLLEGYQIDVGYHGVALNGRGYFYDLDSIIGSGEKAGVKFAGNTNITYIGDQSYLDYMGSLDPKIEEMLKENKREFMEFYLPRVSKEEFDKYEKVSVAQWCRERGIDKNPVLFGMIHALSTLITTINDPEEISVGDIFRYNVQVILPRFAERIAEYQSGFVIGGIKKWSDAVVERFKSFGGELMLNARVEEILIENSKVKGVVINTEGDGKKEIHAPVVVSNIPTQDTFKVADRKHFPPAFVERTEKLRGFGSIAPYFGLKELVLPKAEWDKGMKDTLVIPKGDRLTHNVYMCWNIQSTTDPLCAPRGKQLFTAYAPVTQEEAVNEELMNWACDQIVDYLERRYPGFKDSIDWALFPVSWRLEGVAKDINQAGTMKTPVRAPGVEGLFFAGDTVKGYGVAMDCACAAGMICASEITGKDFGVK